MIECIFEQATDKAQLRHVTMGGIIIQNNKILLVKRVSNLLEGGKYSLAGGFLNRDEHVTEGILRETKEETGYDCEIEQLLRINSKPDRKGEDRQNVDFVFILKPIIKNGTHDDEVSETKWFDLNNLPDENMVAFDHYENIQLYLKYKKGEITLPVMDI